ncbi:MAG TPA: protein kinase [Gemmataceae bacterium]|nr:protein kinase [Gemmataceae bacterium]
MDMMDASAFEQMILKLGLVNEGLMAEIREEVGAGADLQQLISALERKSFMTPWQVGKVLKGDIDGFILGGYKLLYKIQSGSFGRVYRAVDPRDGRVTAVKVLRRRWSEDQARIEMFIREGKVGLMLKHSNIVEVLAINRDPSSGQYYIVMEFVEGGNLREILQIRNKLTVLESLRVVEDCAAGLAYAYARGMTHRDIKLTNILISDTGEAKLVDFGLAQFFSTLARKEDEKVDRTVDYAGLERATGVKIGDVRSDVYFLGCVLYECLTGRPPLVMTRDKHARMRKGRFEEVRPLHPNEIDGPPSVMVLVETAMALDPKERFQTPSQLVDAVRRLRREIEGKSGEDNGRPVQRTVFLAEPDEHLQDVLRDKLKEQGYRVFLAGDPLRALDRFRQSPFDGLIVDARTTGEEGFRVFEHIIDEADRRHLRCAGLLLLDEEQSGWEARLPSGPHVGVLIQDITFKTVSRKLKELMEAAHDSETLPKLVAAPKLPPPAPPPPPPEPPPLMIEPPPRPEPAPRKVETPRRPEPAPPPRREPRPIPAPPSFAPPRKAAAPPPRRESKPAAAFSIPIDEEDIDLDVPLLVPEANAPMSPAYDDLMSPLEDDDDLMPPPGDDSPLPSPEETVTPPHREESAPPPPHEPPKAMPAPAAAAPPSETPAPLSRRPNQRRRTSSPLPHVTHEEPIHSPDMHHWREELHVAEAEEKKEDVWTRMQNFWASLTPKQKSLSGIGLVALVLVVVFSFMISDILVHNKFNKIQEGMAEEEVEGILGGKGEELKLAKNPGRGGDPLMKPKTKKWNVSGRYFVIWFNNGVVVQKQLQED